MFAFVIPTLLIIPIWLYMYRVFFRGITLFVKTGRERGVRLASVMLGGAFSLPLYGLFGGARIWGLFILHTVVFLLITQLLSWLLKKVSGRTWRPWDVVYRLGLIPCACAALLLLWGYVNMHTVVQTNYTVSTQKAIREEGYRVALMADIHFGASMEEEAMEVVAARVSAADTDVVILCGDIVDEGTSKAEMQTVFRILGSIKSTYGVFFVYGNHDRTVYANYPHFTPDELESAIKVAGITILRDQAVMLTGDFALAGREDRSDRDRLSVAELLKTVDDSAFLLLADHQPTDFDEKAEAGVDLQVSGHTHGGQIFPIGHLTPLISANDLCYGLGREGGMTAVVTSGVSAWNFPIRTQAKSEYVIIDITK